MRFEYLVYGYVKEFVKSLDKEQNVPNGIKNIIIKFYDLPAIIIERGSSSIKVGFGGDKSPSIQFPSIVGRPKDVNSNLKQQCYIGHEANANRSLLRIKHPIEFGIVTNWDDMVRCILPYLIIQMSPNNDPTPS